MTWQAAVVVIATALAFVAMARGAPAAAALGITVALLIFTGILSVEQALAGFGNEQLHTVALLFLAASALRRAGSLALISRHLLGAAKSPTLTMIRLTVPIALLSSVLNNTPLVAMMIPEVRSWARRTGIPASRLLIPLSYAAILGGMLTIIGTSTNLVVNGLLTAAGKRPLGFLEIGMVGAPVCVVGLLLLYITSRWLLPDRRDVDAAFSNPRNFTTELIVDAGSPFAGKRLADIAVPELPRFAPVEIQRQGRIIPAPRVDHVLVEGDRLVFAGPVGTMLALRQIPGLSPAQESMFATGDIKAGGESNRQLIELLISPRCPLVGRPVGDGSFRDRYNAAVVAVARHGERLPSERLTDWILMSGDIVLVQAGRGFLERHRFSTDFYMVTPHAAEEVVQKRRPLFGLLVLAAMVLTTVLFGVKMFVAVLGAVIVLFAAQFLRRDAIREGLDLPVLVTIALSFALGKALDVTGAASALARFIGEGGASPWMALALIIVCTSFITEIITNNAAAALMVPLGIATAERLGVSYVPFAAAIMISASASFATPIGYATNLMVYGPGGYKFTDFMRAGIPMNVAAAIVSMVLTPLIWPF